MKDELSILRLHEALIHTDNLGLILDAEHLAYLSKIFGYSAEILWADIVLSVAFERETAIA